MRAVKRLLILTLFCVPFTLADVINKEITRVIDASNSVLRVTTDIKAANVEKEYLLIFPDDVALNLAFLSVSSKGQLLPVHSPIS